ncbi:MAG: hypothetical protein U1E30_17050 [Rhodoblastus sp.]
MRLEVEDQAKAQGTETHGALEQHRQRAQLIAEAAGDAAIVVLFELGALQEKFPDRILRQNDQQDEREDRESGERCRG